MENISGKVSRRRFLGLTSIMTLHSLGSGQRVLGDNAPREFRIRVAPDALNRSASDRLSGLFDDLTRGIVLEHRHLEAEYCAKPDRSLWLRLRDTESGQTMETLVRRDGHFGIEEVHRFYAEALRLAAHMAPDEVYLVRALGDYYLAFHRFKEGIACFQDFIAAHPGHTHFSFQLGIIYDRAGRKREAYDVFRRVNRLDPEDAVTLYNLGVIASELGHYHEAEQWFMEALARNSNMDAAWLRLDRLHQQMKRGKSGAGFKIT